MNKINLIFDIDATLINTLDFNFYNHSKINIGSIENFKIGIIHWATYLALVFLRPYLEEFLFYCFKNFNVGFWTAGNPLYCKEILKLILSEEQYNLTNIILAREGKDYINLKNHTVYNDVNTDDTKKPLEKIWNDINLMDEFNPKNTILIDDNVRICLENPLNSINVPRFDRFSKKDEFLIKLKLILELIKDFSDVRIMDRDVIESNFDNL